MARQVRSTRLLDMMADDSEQTASAPAGDNMLKNISALAFEQLELERKVEEKLLELAELQKSLARIQLGSLPEALKEAKVLRFTLDDGHTVELKEGVEAHISEEHKEAAFKWLRDNKCAGLIKTEMTASFGRNSQALVKQVEKTMKALKVPVKTKQSVHPQTLKKFVNERLEAGKPVPTETFGVFPYSKANIKAPPEKK